VSKQSVYRANRWGDLLWVRAAVGGKDSSVIKVRLLVDTGASFTLLPTKVVQLVGCNLEQPIRTQNVTAAGGTLAAPIVIVPWFNCLGQRIENFSVFAYTIPASTFMDGLLGMDVLRQYQAVIAVAQAEIRLTFDD
jgi:aspartyl protease family protein